MLKIYAMGSEIVITIHGDPRTKKNSQQLVSRGGRMIPIPSKAYREYRETFAAQAGHLSQPLGGKWNVQCLYYMQTRRKVDLVNLLEATNDLLVDSGVLPDDNSLVIASHDGSRVRYDKEDPRVEIIMQRVDE